MSKLSWLPEKYYIIWLDSHIGDPKFCQELKNTFFTRITPNDINATAFSDDEINALIQNQSEIPLSIEGVHFTFKAFIEVEPCLEYIEKIRNDRIILIASSRLGQPAVEQIFQNFPEIFVNKQTHEPYRSIYIFCTDIAKVADWGDSFEDYMLAFDFEKDLLERMTRELAKEFLQQAKQLDNLKQYAVALERVSWARNLLIHHEDLMGKSACQKQYRNIAQKKLQEVEQFIDYLELKMKNDDDLEEIDSTLSIPNETKHAIIFLDELNQRTSDRNQQTNKCLSNLPVQLDICNDVENAIDSIINNQAKAMTMSIIIIASNIEKTLSRLSTKNDSIDKIYILGNYLNQMKNIQIFTFHNYESLLVKLLEDVSESYLLKGKHLMLIYFDWAKELLMRASELKQDQFKQQMETINQQKHQTDKRIQQKNINNTLEQQIERYLNDEDSDYTVMIFLVGLKEQQPIDFDSDLARVLSCQTAEQLVSLVHKIELKNPIVIVSNALPSDEVLSLSQLLFYFCLGSPGKSVAEKSKIYHVLSIEHLVSQLYNRLGEYYREISIKLSMKYNDQDQDAADRLLERSTKCYKILKSDIQKTIQRYKEILKTK